MKKELITKKQQNVLWFQIDQVKKKIMVLNWIVSLRLDHVNEAVDVTSLWLNKQQWRHFFWILF